MRVRTFSRGWGDELCDTSLAMALVALGIVPERLRRGDVPPDIMEDGLRLVLTGHKKEILHWKLNVPPGRKTSWTVKCSAKRFADIIRACRENHRRLAIPARGIVDGLELRRHFQSAFEDNWWFHVTEPVPGNTIRFRWPSRVGYFSGNKGEKIGMRLAKIDSWDQDIYAVSELTRRNPECDMLVFSGTNLNKETKLQLLKVVRDIGGVSTDLLILFVSRQAMEAIQIEYVNEFKRMVDASGVLIIEADPTNEPTESSILKHFFEEISHNVPLDVAAAIATGNLGILITAPELIEKAWLQHRTLAMAHSMRDSHLADETIILDDDSAGMLRVPYPKTSRGAAAETIIRNISSYTWDQESFEASAVGRTFRRLNEDDENLAGLRFLQAGVCPEYDPYEPIPKTWSLYSEESYLVRVLIGEPEKGFIRLEQPFPKLDPPDDGRAHRLMVVFWASKITDTPMVSHIELPVSGSSSSCAFPITIPSGIDTLRCRITVLHRNRVLQSGILEMPVEHSNIKGSFKLDALPRTVLAGLDRRTNFDTAFLLNDIDDEGKVHGFSGDRAVVIDIDHPDIKQLDKIIDMVFSDITRNPEPYSGFRAEKTEDLLRRLAQKGARLRKHIMQHVRYGDQLGSPSHVQIVSAKPGKLFPLEFMYQFEVPEPDAKICTKAESALSKPFGKARDICADGCIVRSDGEDDPRPAEEEKVICPLAFWGLRCKIERRVHDPEKVDFSNGFKLVPQPVKEQESVLHPLDCTVVGATPKANNRDVYAVANMVSRIKRVSKTVHTVDGWDQWEDTLKNNDPSLLTLIIHTVDDFGTPSFDLGKPPTLNSDLLKPKHVRPNPDGRVPIALLIGCETALARIDYENFALRFQDEGAAFVISTVAKVLGQQAAPVTAELIEAMAKATEPISFSEIMVNLRRKLLKEGTPMVLALTAHGDADWEIVNQ
jgi:hypothetical protein